MTGGGTTTVSEFDVCVVERMRFREEEVSEQIRFSLLGGWGVLCHAPRAATSLGLTRSEVDDKTL